MTAPDTLFDAALFRAWLAAHPADMVVGHAWESDRCPVATWLQERYDEGYRVEHDGEVIRFGGGDVYESIQAPSWVGEFAMQVDAAHPFYEEGESPVRADVALSVFDQFCVE